MTPALVGTGVRSRHRGCGLGTVPHLNSGSLGSPPGFTQAFFRFFFFFLTMRGQLRQFVVLFFAL